MDEVEIVSIMDFLLHFVGIIDTCQTDLFLDEKIIKVGNVKMICCWFLWYRYFNERVGRADKD